jgi:NAD(P)-dependent dehydrogenase (short-subunit alcohol dehydrogenase family)
VLATNLLAPQALLAVFDPMLRKAERADVFGVTSTVGHEPRAFWGAYGSSKAALENLLGAYADETEHTGRIRVHLLNPGPTRTRMRQLAFPGEEPESVKPPEAVAEFILQRLSADVKTGELVRAEG